MIANPPYEPVPIRINAMGVAYVGDMRVTLDTVVGSFNEGATPEEIVQQYPALKLADMYAVIAYYLGSRPEVEAYLFERQQRSEKVRQENEARFNPIGIREGLLARLIEKE